LTGLAPTFGSIILIAWTVPDLSESFGVTLGVADASLETLAAMLMQATAARAIAPERFNMV